MVVGIGLPLAGGIDGDVGGGDDGSADLVGVATFQCSHAGDVLDHFLERDGDTEAVGDVRDVGDIDRPGGDGTETACATGAAAAADATAQRADG
ncbi:MAG TPA: hypothetical protein QGH10_15995 [Armatimonadota bacterium]|nr:hypothetical protein [Armatimonadota bacterium]